MAYNGRSWADLKPGARSFFRSPTWCRGPRVWASSTAFPGRSRELDRKWSSRAGTALPNPLCFSAGPQALPDLKVFMPLQVPAQSRVARLSQAGFSASPCLAQAVHLLLCRPEAAGEGLGCGLDSGIGQMPPARVLSTRMAWWRPWAFCVLRIHNSLPFQVAAEGPSLQPRDRDAGPLLLGPGHLAGPWPQDHCRSRQLVVSRATASLGPAPVWLHSPPWPLAPGLDGFALKSPEPPHRTPTLLAVVSRQGPAHWRRHPCPGRPLVPASPLRPGLSRCAWPPGTACPAAGTEADSEGWPRGSVLGAGASSVVPGVHQLPGPSAPMGASGAGALLSPGDSFSLVRSRGIAAFWGRKLCRSFEKRSPGAPHCFLGRSEDCARLWGPHVFCFPSLKKKYVYIFIYEAKSERALVAGSFPKRPRWPGWGVNPCFPQVQQEAGCLSQGRHCLPGCRSAGSGWWVLTPALYLHWTLGSVSAPWALGAGGREAGAGTDGLFHRGAGIWGAGSPHHSRTAASAIPLCLLRCSSLRSV
nr:uncharacterized protein LOC127485772 [Oryctolagus cuniculus]